MTLSMKVVAVAAVLSAAQAEPARGLLDLPDLPDLPLPDIGGFGDGSTDHRSHCSDEVLAQYPSGWPVQLDTGIYWFGPNDTFEKAVPGENNPYYDPTKKTLLYFHGWLGSGTTEQCRRVTTRCDRTLCPNGGGQLLSKPWLERGWNIGFFYWDQFADEPCMRDAEQKIWFDHGGNGLRWASYDTANRTAKYEHYSGKVLSVADLCVTAVQENMGDFLGETVRFVGRSIGAQLAVRCAAKLHQEQHQAAPQRMAMLEPFFTRHSVSILGASFRCDKLTTESGIEGFTAEATANFVKGLWNRSRVVTEVYTSSKPSDIDVFAKANEDLARHVALVEYEPAWCEDNNLQCERRAVFPIYFLSYGSAPPQLVRSEPETVAGACNVPSSSCSDAAIRALVERQLAQADKQAWQQWGGLATFDFADDTFTVTGPMISGPITPNPLIEEEVSRSPVLLSRDPSPKLRIGKRIVSLSTILAALAAAGAAIALVTAVVCFVTRATAYSGYSSEGELSGSDDEEDEEEGPSKLESRLISR